MTRLLIIVFFCTVFFDTSSGQKPKETVITKTVDSKTNSFKDTAFLNRLAAAYGKSFVDALLKDTAFINSMGDTSLSGNGEFASSQYKIQFPIKA